MGCGRGSSLQLLLLLLLLVVVLLSLPLHNLLLLLADVLLPLHLQVMRVRYSVAGGRRRRVSHVVLFVEVGVGRMRRLCGRGGAQRQVVPVARSGGGCGSHGAACARGVHCSCARRVSAACAEVGEAVRRWQDVVRGRRRGCSGHGGRLLSPASGLRTVGRGGCHRRAAPQLGILDGCDCGGMLPGMPGGGRRCSCDTAGERLMLVRAGRRRRSLVAGGLVHLLTLM